MWTLPRPIFWIGLLMAGVAWFISHVAVAVGTAVASGALHQ
jgi:hypothetical protein